MPRRQRTLFAGMLVLLGIGLPWYRDGGSAPAIWWGVPDWFAIAALCWLGIAALNALAWRRSEWSDETSDPP